MDSTAERFQAARELISGSLGGFLPETVLGVAVCVLFLHDLFGGRARPRRAAFVAAGALALCGIVLALQWGTTREIFGWKEGGLHRGLLRLDGFAFFFKSLVLLGTLVTIPMCLAFRGFDGRRMGEFYAMLLGATLGMFLMCGATNLLMIYLGIEFASMASYLLTAFIKRDVQASEAGLKYVIYGSVASGVMIFGISLIYGMTGSLHVDAVAAELSLRGANQVGLLTAGVLAFAGFAYKMAAFPMHFWCPDVYQGAPVPFTAYLSVTSKAAGFAVFVRFLMGFGQGFDARFPGFGGLVETLDFGWPELVAIASALSMTVGNFAALWQTNIKRMLAYSSVAHAGYLMMGVAVLVPGSADRSQFAPLIFYFVAYFFMNLGAFYVATVVSSRLDTEVIDGYTGLGRRAPLLAGALALFMISLIGIPPTVGFIGKFQLIGAAIDGGYVWLAVVAVINSVVSAAYYMRLLKVMYLDAGTEITPVRLGAGSAAMIWAFAVPVLVFGLAFGPIAALSRQFAI